MGADVEMVGDFLIAGASGEFEQDFTFTLGHLGQIRVVYCLSSIDGEYIVGKGLAREPQLTGHYGAEALYEVFDGFIRVEYALDAITDGLRFNLLLNVYVKKDRVTTLMADRLSDTIPIVQVTDIQIVRVDDEDESLINVHHVHEIISDPGSAGAGVTFRGFDIGLQQIIVQLIFTDDNDGRRFPLFGLSALLRYTHSRIILSSIFINANLSDGVFLG